MIRHIFFDVDDTLLDFRRGEDTAIRRTLADMGIAVTDAVVRRYCAINDALWKRLERGEITREEILVGRFEQLYDALGVCADAQKTQNLYFSYLGQQHDCMPGAKALLDTLYGAYTLYIVTNGTEVLQRQRITDAGIGRYFREIFISQQIGAEKPSKAFFDACFSALQDVKREETMIVGDSLSSDMRGGIDAGIRTCWFNPHESVCPQGISVDHEIRQLSELPALLDSIHEKSHIHDKP